MPLQFEAEKICTLALVHTPGIGAVTIRQLISYCGSAEKVFDAGYKRLIRIPGVGEKIVKTILEKQALQSAEREMHVCKSAGGSMHFFTDPDYPLRLKSLYDAPIVLYSQGNLNFNAARTVGIVGTRQITDYGQQVTETIVKELEPYNATVVSGLAYGVDIAAHRACLRYHVPTWGVMASGLDVVYPATHKRTAIEMREAGGLITENAMGTKPDFMRFPARNRIIAGLSDVTIVVESGKKGGSLITVEFAQNYHRDVFAVPGMIGSSQSEGCNQLIRDHKASIFTSVEDMAHALGWSVNAGGNAEHISPATLCFEGFTQDEGQVLSILRTQGTLHIDELAWQSGLHLNKLATLLLNLEFQGMLRSLPGKKYRLI